MNEHWNHWIERIMAGEHGVESPELNELLKDPEFLRRLDSAYETQAALDQESVLEEARESEPLAVEDRIENLVRRQVGAQASSRRWSPPWLLLAASLLLAALLYRVGTVDVDIPPTPLGVNGMQCLSPMGSTSSFELFRWSHDRAFGTYDVEVYPVGEGELLGGRSGPLGNALEWRPDPSDIESWPDAIEWQLRWTPPGGGAPLTVFGAASR